MDVRMLTGLVVAAAALPLLAGCGGATEAAPAASATSVATAASSSAPVPRSSSPAPTTDPAAERKAVVDASEKFIKTGLTIGYPDKDVDTYANRVEPLMTSKGFEVLFEGDSRTSASKAVEQLSSKKARTTPKLVGTTKVQRLGADAATTTVSLRNVAQVRDGDGWRTLKTSGTESTTLRLVKQDGTWLVDDAS